MSVPFDDSPTSSGPAAPGLGTVPSAPPRVPDHELIRSIGRGAYGEVWLAKSITGAYRAVKIVRRSSFDHQRPFEREFEGILKFEPISRTHSSQVDILHVGRADNLFYYVMELADDQDTGGQINLDNYAPRTIKSDLGFRSRLPFEECVQIGVALATALEHLHQNGLVHRDVKPSNVIFVNGVAKLADIGLVTDLDATRSYVGTEGFAAPEGPGTPQADIFSFGKVLYEMCTGKDRQEFPELPTNLLDFPDREGLKELNAVISKACRHDPKDRYTSAGAMRADLELLQSGKSLARLHRIERRLRLATRAAAVVAVLTVLAIGAWFYQARKTQIVRDLASEKARLAEENQLQAVVQKRLADENRERVFRLDVANGVRLMDEGDFSAALLWFADALPLVKDKPSVESTHRVRIQQLLRHMPQLLWMKTETNSVRCTAFSPDGKLVATSSDRLLRMWDRKSARELWTRELKRPLNIGFSSDGLRLLGSSTRPALSFPSTNAIAAVFDVTSGEILFHPLNPNYESVTDFSPDGRWLVTSDTNHVIRVVDATNGNLMAELKGHTDSIMRFSFNEEGSMMASASWDKTARLWRLPSGEPVGQPFQHTHGLYQVALTPNGQWLATATPAPPPAANGEAQVLIWNIKTGEPVAQPKLFEGPFFALSFDPSSRWLLAGGGELFVRVLDPATSTEPYPPLRTDGMIRSWAFDTNGSVAVGSDDGRARVWSLEAGKLKFPPIRHSGWLESLQFAPDNSQLITVGEDGSTRLWSLHQRAVSDTVLLDVLDKEVGLEEFASTTSDDKKRLAISFLDGVVHVVELKPLRIVHKLVPSGRDRMVSLSSLDRLGHLVAASLNPNDVRGAKARHPAVIDLCRMEREKPQQFSLQHPAVVIEFRFDKSGHLVSFCGDQNFRFWKTDDGTLAKTISLTGILPSQGCWVSPDARTAIFYVPAQNGYQIFDVASGKPVGQPISLRINDLAFDSTGKRFATVSLDQRGRIWSAETGERLVGPFKHGGYVGNINWRPDDLQVITSGLWPEAKVWDTSTGEMLLAPLRIGVKPTRLADWSPDSRFIVTSSDEQLVRVWDAETGEAVTPLLNYFRALLVTENRIVVLSHPNRLQAIDLDETDLTSDVISDYAKLLAGRRLNASGVLLSLSARELRELHRSVFEREPSLFIGL